MDIKINNQIENVSRRSFLKGLGVTSGALVLGGVMPSSMPVFAMTQEMQYKLNLFVTINTDNSIDIICHRSEMGQGVRTCLPQIVADELEADWQKVNVVQGLANNEYGNQNTDGSSSVRDFYDTLRQMGASAKQMLEQAAAETWKVPVSEVKAQDHLVKHQSGKTLSYGDLAETAARITPPKVEALKLKNKADFKYIGKPLTSVDLPDVLAGTTEFGQDVNRPNMVIATIERAPVLGAKVKQFNADKAKAVKGVVDVIKIDGTDGAPAFNPLEGIAVLATNTYAAQKAQKLLEIEWQLTDNKNHHSAEYLQQRKAMVQQQGKVHRTTGDVNKAFSQYKNQVNATYTVPYLAHAPMEPPAATAEYRADGTCEVWACVQAPQRTRDVVAARLGIEKDKVTVNTTLLGGAFGRKSKPDFVAEAALLAKAAKRPVKVIWSREEDIQFDYVHAISAQHYQAAFDDKKQVKAWLARTSFPTIGSTFDGVAKEPQTWETQLGFADVPFAIENLQCEVCEAPHHLRIGWVRSVGNIQHGFGVGSFVDEMAHQVGQDPKQMWLDLYADDRLVDVNQGGYKYGNYWSDIKKYPIETKRFKNVVELVTERAGWGRKLPKGQGLGLSVHRSFLSYIAVVTQVEVKNDTVKVQKMWCVADCGIISNIDRVEAQMEGSMIFGMSIALLSKLTAKDGKIEQSNFHDYELVRMNQSPQMDIHIVESDAPPAGVGEPGVPPVSASITNAIFAACGKRIRDLPVKGQLNIA
ncbi:xanthine dehydrogenase family protein molybdopterin-binding subunit [Catenovulum sp. SM1970]|uniref:molybdopterin cofactor-binding domain-containing protein n=1 Tax=Marinifaba aquimaris TaxID=2741323 RepID=UPI0015749849|nr:molybdopterin cofactor-binding domain-containing protein [Marinifaba aquimaris]NTS77579.1 xanthine dehydrogenase family protein molybdopterin-binding subunit [Marinifaba aquimaris]